MANTSPGRTRSAAGVGAARGRSRTSQRNTGASAIPAMPTERNAVRHSTNWAI